MVECELSSACFRCISVFVLIDTWWNVNVIFKRIDTTHNKVLIDTWWNVNILPLCVSSKVSVVLIDTWWNVNLAVFDVVTFVL